MNESKKSCYPSFQNILRSFVLEIVQTWQAFIFSSFIWLKYIYSKYVVVLQKDYYATILESG